MLCAILISLSLLASAWAGEDLPEFLKPGKCADVAVQKDFDLSRYGGRWYHTEVIDNPYMPYVKCINSVYDISGDGFDVTTDGVDSNDEHQEMQGKIYSTDAFQKAHMQVDFPDVIGSPFKVIETDYESYSCVYSCLDWSSYKTEFGFVFSRSPQNSGIATKKCAEVFKRNGVDVGKFMTIPQSSKCDYRS
ncbi:hypothetical protein SK128_008425 [Halocaridina rubra]|uniref:Lipocalin/cytosolic fatty-acid binding domain-containing protein n=1 Tax=Halocaridina rubra TaxID=373956 RepID=A0AAN8XKG4_HALRR